MPKRFLFGLFFSFLISLPVSLPRLAAAVPDEPLTGRYVAFALVKAVDGAPVELAPGTLQLLTYRAHVASAKQLDQLLRTNGIYPDNEAYALFYDLNPSLQDFAALSPIHEYVLLRLQGENLTSQLKQGYLVALLVEGELKRSLTENTARLIRQYQSLPNLKANWTRNSTERKSTLDSLDEITQTLQTFRRAIVGKVLPLNYEIISQLNAETAVLVGMLNKVGKSAPPLRIEDLVTVKLIEQDIRVKQRALDEARGPGQPPSRWPDNRVVVQTRKADDGKEVPGLRIYYAPEALYANSNSAKTFDMLSSPSERTLPEANYRVWAGRADNAAPVSDVKNLEVRKETNGQAIRVDLIVVK